MEAVLAQQDQLYALMQHLKAAGHLQLLQFYKDISKEYSIKVVLTYAGNKKVDMLFLTDLHLREISSRSVKPYRRYLLTSIHLTSIFKILVKSKIGVCM